MSYTNETAGAPEPATPSERIAGKQLIGMPVYSIDDGERRGQVHDIVFNPESRHLSGLFVRHAEGILGGGSTFYVKDSDIRAIGADAITVPNAALLESTGDAGSSVSDGLTVLGKRLITDSGTFLGAIDDVVLDCATRDVVAYTVSGGLWQDLTRGHGEIAAVDVLTIGKDAVVVPDRVRESLEPTKTADAQARTDAESTTDELGQADAPGVQAGLPGDPEAVSPPPRT